MSERPTVCRVHATRRTIGCNECELLMEVERLEAEQIQLTAALGARDGDVADAVERAAKMVENVLPWPGQITLAAAIRAKIQREAGVLSPLADDGKSPGQPQGVPDVARHPGPASRTSTGDAT